MASGRRTTLVTPRVHRRMLGVVAALVAATLVGLIVLWPPPVDLPAPVGTPPELVEGVVVGIDSEAVADDPVLGTGQSLHLEVELSAGPEAGSVVEVPAATSERDIFELGDRLALARGEVGGEVQYHVADFVRDRWLGWLGVLFLAVVLVVGRWHGLRALLGVAVSLAVVALFIVPAILAGSPPPLVAVIGGMAVVLTNLYLAHGFHPKTTAAVLGTAAALAVTAVLGLTFVEQTQLTGFSSEEALLAQTSIQGLDLQGLVLAGLIVGALGVLDDVTITQAATVFELRDSNPILDARELVRRAMVVGRDHIASTVNTLVLAYAGASLALLVLVSTAGRPLGQVLTSEVVAEEIVRTLVGSIGLVLAVPAATVMAAVLAGPPAGRRGRRSAETRRES